VWNRANTLAPFSLWRKKKLFAPCPINAHKTEINVLSNGGKKLTIKATLLIFVFLSYPFRGASDSAKNRKRQSRKRQFVTAK